MHSDFSELLYCARNETSRLLRIENWNDGRVVQVVLGSITFFNRTGRQIMSMKRLHDQKSGPGDTVAELQALSDLLDFRLGKELVMCPFL